MTLQETAYALLLEKQRRKLHERYATYLEEHHLSGRKGETSTAGGGGGLVSPAGIRKLLGMTFILTSIEPFYRRLSQKDDILLLSY